MPVVDLKGRTKRVRKRAPRDLVPLDKVSGAGRFFAKMVTDIRGDLGGRRRQPTRVADELIEAFAGCAVALRYQTHQLLLGDISELDLSGYATLASTMLRIGSRLGLHRRQELVPSLDEFLRARGHQPLNNNSNDSDDDDADEEDICPSSPPDAEVDHE
jgi:hypothetical protein